MVRATRPRTSRGPRTAECEAGSRRSDSPSRRPRLPATCARSPRPAASHCRALRLGRPRRRPARWTRPGREARRLRPPPVPWPGSCRDAGVEDVVRCGYPLAEGSVDVGARLLDVAALVSGELQPGQAAHVVVVRDRGAGHDGSRDRRRRHGPAGYVRGAGNRHRLGPPSRRGGPPLLRDRPATSGMPDKISLICAWRRLRGSSCPSS